MNRLGAIPEIVSMTVVTFDAPGLGDRSYLITDGKMGVVVDPQRDPLDYLRRG